MTMKTAVVKTQPQSLLRGGAAVILGVLIVMANSNTSTGAEKHDLTVTRVFGAPVEKVWKAWSDSNEVMKWWGPTGFTAPLAKIDFREGGTSLVCMRPPQGPDLCNTWTYRTIAPMERIEFVQGWADKDGNEADPVKMGLPPDIPREVPHVVTFKAVGDGKTEIAITEFGYPSQQIVDLSRAGMEQVLDKMAASFAGP